jgi:hypothetical protein
MFELGKELADPNKTPEQKSEITSHYYHKCFKAAVKKEDAETDILSIAGYSNTEIGKSDLSEYLYILIDLISN